MKIRDEIVKALGTCYKDHRIHVGNFACPHRSQCEKFAQPRALREGMEAHVGSLYGERPRLVVVSLDSGNASEDLQTRSRGVDPITPENAGNPHMVGTTKFVQFLNKAEIQKKLPMAHVAMLNSAKCAGDDDNMRTVPSAVHFQCREYLFEEIHILEPDLIWLQGTIVHDAVVDHLIPLSDIKDGFSRWLANASTENQRLAHLLEPIAREYIYLFSDGERKIVTIITPHPSDQGGRWQRFWRSVMPLIADVATSLAQAGDHK